MSYLVDTKKLHRIQLNEPFSVPVINMETGTVTEQWRPPFDDSEHWVDILDEMSDYERRSIQTRAESMAFQSGDQALTGVRMSSTNYERMQLALFGKTIKGWSLTDGERPLPVNEDIFRRLGPVGAWLEDAIWAHYLHQQLTPAQVKNFVGVPSPFTSEAAPSTPRLSESTSRNGTEPSPIESTADLVTEIEPSPGS
ncbi:MAG: hypothetical protein AB7R89_16210 [Dehalococcoidia bacterium]